MIQTESCFWYKPHRFAFMSIPYHRIVTPSNWELARLFMGGPAMLARFPSGLGAPSRESWLFACTNRNYDFCSLHQKARSQTRRGLEACSVEQVDFRYLAKWGHRLNVDTFERQGRSARSISESSWCRYCQAAGRFPAFEAWMAFVGGQPAALLVASLVEDCYSILQQSSSSAYLSQNPNNALTFTVTKLKVSRPEVAFVSYGLNSLEFTAGLEHYKLRMGFERRFFRERLFVNPALVPFLALGGRIVANRMAQKHPESDFWRKASALLQLNATEAACTYEADNVLEKNVTSSKRARTTSWV